MTYLILQILLYIVLAAIVGFFAGWLMRSHGLKSKLVASENQWRVKNHILQDENDRLQTDLENLKSKEGSSPDSSPVENSEPASESLPFKSAANRLSQDDAVSLENVDQPLSRLRAKLAHIEEEEKLKSVSSATESHNDDQYHEEEASNEKDDLQQIKGIDASIEATLNSMGVYRYSQIANFSAENVVWIDEYMKFKEEIVKNDWVGQAIELMSE